MGAGPGLLPGNPRRAGSGGHGTDRARLQDGGFRGGSRVYGDPRWWAMRGADALSQILTGWGFWGVGVSPDGCKKPGVPRAFVAPRSAVAAWIYLRVFAAQSGGEGVGLGPPPLLNRDIQSLPGAPEANGGLTNSGHLARDRAAVGPGDAAGC